MFKKIGGTILSGLMGKGGSGKDSAEKGVKMALSAMFLMVFALILPFLILMILIWNILSNYQYCTLPFERECWKPDSVFQQDPVTDTEIEYFIQGRKGALATLGGLIAQEASSKDESKGIIQVREDFKKMPDLDVLPEVYLSGEDAIPVLDSESIMKVEGNVFFKEYFDSKGTETKQTDETLYQEEGNATANGPVYNINQNTEITSTLKAELASKLKRDVGVKNGNSNLFRQSAYNDVLNWYIEAGQKNGIDPVFLVAVSIHETGYFTSPNVHQRKNVGGIRCITKPELTSKFNITGCYETKENGSFSVFASIKDSINYKADLLRREYAEKGFLTVSEVGGKYAPLTDTNDPDALNNNWTTNVAKNLQMFGITNVGTLTFYPPGVNDMVIVAKPNFEKYKPYLQVYSWKGLTKIQGDKSMREYMRKYENYIKDKQVLSDLKKNRLDELSTEKFNDVVKSIGGTAKDGKISEAELHVRTLMQLDLQGLIGIDGYVYEAANALLRTSNQLENIGKTTSSKSQIFWNNELSFSEEAFEIDKERFMEYLVKYGYTNSKMATDDLNISYFLKKSYPKRNEILAASARDGYIYPYLYIGLGEVHPDIDDTKALKKQVDEALTKLMEEESLTEETLSALSVGHYLKRNALDTFRMQYGWASFNKDDLVKDFRVYVQDERKRATSKDEVPEGDIVSNLKSDLNVVGNARNFWKRLTNYNYFDVAMKNNNAVRYAMFTETRELIEIGAWSRTNCYLLENYDSFFCTKANASAYKDGIYTWFESDTLDKAKHKLDVGWVCIPKIVEEEPEVSNEKTEKEAKATTGPKKVSSSDSLEEKPIMELLQTPGVNVAVVENPTAVAPMVEQKKEDVAVANWFIDSVDWVSQKVVDLAHDIATLPLMTLDYISKLYGEVTGFFAYHFSSWWINDEPSKPRDPYIGEHSKYMVGLPSAAGENAILTTEGYLELYYDLIAGFTSVASFGETVGVKLSFPDSQDSLVKVGWMSVDGEGNISLYFIDINDNMERTISIAKPKDCNPKTEILVATPSRYITPFYQTVYQIFAQAGNFNLYHSMLGTHIGDSSSTLVTSDSNISKEGIVDGGITGGATGEVLFVESTAYVADCPGCSGITKTGIDARVKPTPKVIAVDPNVIPLGTYVHVEGYGEAIAGDTGGAIKGNIIDVLVPDITTANQWGRKKNVKVTILSAKPPGYGSGVVSDTAPVADENNPFGTKGTATSNPNVFEWEKIDSPMLSGDTDIHPTLASRLIAIAAAYGKTNVNVTSGSRTLAEQAKLFKEKPHLAVEPGKSKHNAGLAVDIDNRWLLDLRDADLKKFGLHKPVMFKGEDWHIEVLESGTSIGKSNRSNAEIIQILGGVNGTYSSVGLQSNLKGEGAEFFRAEVLEFFKEMTNVDYVRDTHFITSFEEYLTNRYGESGGIANSNGPGTGPGGVGGNLKNPNPALFNGLEIQAPLNRSEGQKIVMTSGFGNRTLSGTTKLHTGLDLLAPGGAGGKIISIADGTVYKVENTNGASGWGSHVVIEHLTSTGKFYSLYAHLVHNSIPSNLLSVGAKITRGDVLGTMGNTGASQGVHLHFNIYENAYSTPNLVDPTTIIGLNSSNAYCTPNSQNCIGKHGIGTK